MKRFIQGVLTMACLTSLYQDIVFKDAQGMATYLFNGGWIDRAATIPIAILGLLIVGMTWGKS